MNKMPKFTKFRNRRSSNERSRERSSPGRDSDREQRIWQQPTDRNPNDDDDNKPSTSFRDGSERGYRGQYHERGHGRDRVRQAHPPELRGRAIGLYYSRRHGIKTGNIQPRKGPHHRLQIRLGPEKEKEIQALLDVVRKTDQGFSRDLQMKREPSTPPPLQHQIQLTPEEREYIKAFCGRKVQESSHNVSASTSHIKSEDTGCNIKSEDKSVTEDCHFQSQTVKKRKKNSIKSASNQEGSNINPSNSCHDQYQNIRDSMFKRNFLQSITESIEDKLDRTLQSQSILKQDHEMDQNLIDNLLAKEASAKYQKMLAFRKKLPAFEMKEKILDLIHNNQVIVVSGETGCGKTTQVAQFILDDMILQNKGSTCHVICTQPRRISATSVAQRVADERDEVLGQGRVGYQIRLERKLPSKYGSILFCTTGVLLQRMQSDPALCDVSHLVLDEIHERDTVCDFVITLLRDVIAKRRDLKLILMSATLNADHFSKYFNNCPCINIPGFTFPVEELYLEDVLELTHFVFPPSNAPSLANHKWKKYTKMGKKIMSEEQEFHDMLDPYLRNMDTKKYSKTTIEGILNSNSEKLNYDLIAELIVHICQHKPDGAILVFLPGWTDISALNKIITSDQYFSPSRFLIIPLHSMMPTTFQRSVFDRPPPGVRKIILATNIAETSITIDDVVYVIDSGKIKMKQYDVESNIQTLLPEWVSLANSRQRRGRAGRVQPGVCYHLYSRAREMTLASYPLPEMLRSRLEEVILTAKIQQVGAVKPFLQRVMNPPDPRAVDNSLQLLFTMNALDKGENLTPLGYHLAKLPLDPQTGKMILLGALFSCVDPIFSIAASLSFKDAFHTPLGREVDVDKRKLELSGGSKSDHLLLANVIRLWEQAEQRGKGPQFCWDNFLSKSTLKLLKDMKEQFGRYLYDMKFLSSANPKAPEANVNSHNKSLVKAVICAGLYPNVAFLHRASRNKRGVRQKISTMEEERVYHHPRSVNVQLTEFESPFLVYHLKQKSTQIYLHDSTIIYPMPLLFFGETIKHFTEDGKDMVSVNDYIRFECKKETADLIMELRHYMGTVLEDKVCHPETISWTEPKSREGSILRAIAELIAFEDKQIMYGYADGYDDSDVDSED